MLILRLSAMGDIVLTTPVIRTVAQAWPEAEVHVVTKAKFQEALRGNPYVTQHHIYEAGTVQQAGAFHYTLDLQRNLRSLRLTWQLGRSAGRVVRFPKANFTKWRMVRLKQHLTAPHVVQRYACTLRPLGLKLDGGGLDFFVSPQAQAWARQELTAWQPQAPEYLAVVLGATHATKQWPAAHHAALLNLVGLPAVLLGGPAEAQAALSVMAQAGVPILNKVGQTSLDQSAALLQASSCVITHDTGLMHIAAALGRPIVSLWGNTVPGFGMTPYQTHNAAAEVAGLSCRPCSKIGFQECPKGHFRCMNNLLPHAVARQYLQLMQPR